MKTLQNDTNVINCVYYHDMKRNGETYTIQHKVWHCHYCNTICHSKKCSICGNTSDYGDSHYLSEQVCNDWGYIL